MTDELGSFDRDMLETLRKVEKLKKENLRLREENAILKEGLRQGGIMLKDINRHDQSTTLRR